MELVFFQNDQEMGFIRARDPDHGFVMFWSGAAVLVGPVFARAIGFTVESNEVFDFAMVTMAGPDFLLFLGHDLRGHAKEEAGLMAVDTVHVKAFSF